MATEWLETFLGLTGKYVLSFLDKYYFYFIPVIIVYGIFLTLCSINLKRIEKRLIMDIIGQTKKILKDNPTIGFINLLENLDISLEEIIKRASFFPFISSESALWPLKTKLANVRDLILYNDRRILLLLERKGIAFSEKDKRFRKNLYLEVIQKISESK